MSKTGNKERSACAFPSLSVVPTWGSLRWENYSSDFKWNFDNYMELYITYQNDNIFETINDKEYFVVSDKPENIWNYL